MKFLKKIGLVFLFIAILIFVAYKIIYKSHRNIEQEKASFTIVNSNILQEFNTDVKTANAKYADKTGIVYGKITEIDKQGITINDYVYAQFENINLFSGKLGDTIRVKGRCIGYDELLEIVRFDQCSIIN